MKTVKVES